MKISSAKAKGREFCKEVREDLLKAFSEFEADDVRVTPSGVTGEDLQLSPKARSVLPIAIEAKNQESLNIWKAIEQARSHARHKSLAGRAIVPVVCFRKNREEPFACVPWPFLIDLLKLRSTVNSSQVRQELAEIDSVLTQG